MPISSINPATGEVLQTFDALNERQIEEKIARAAETFREHRRTSFANRAEKMSRAACVPNSDIRFTRLAPPNLAVSSALHCGYQHHFSKVVLAANLRMPWAC